MHDAQGSIPVTYDNENGDGGADKGRIKAQQRVKRQSQRDAVVKCAALFNAFDFAFCAAGFEAGGTEMPATDFAVAKRAKEPTAAITGHNGFFLRMIETG